MIINRKDLGKVSLTCEGLWSRAKTYERISMVHDGLYSSYISKKDVPAGIELGNPDYWQPVASLKEDFKIELLTVRKEIIDLIATVTYKLRSSRIVVANEAERKALTYKDIAVGCEVYEKDTKRTYILDILIPETNAQRWHIESDGLIDSIPKYAFSGKFDGLVADRAIADQYGRVIDQTYLTTDAINEFIKNSVRNHLTNIGAVIQPGSIKPNDLSLAVLELIGYGNITNLPDEEDLTCVKKCNGTKVLKFKDKQYVENSFTGDGIIYLRKNWVGNVNVLDQCAINKSNTIYIIKYDFCLYGKTIIVPENVTLDFQGGHILNGTLILNKTKVKGIVGSIYDYLKCDVVGTFLDGQISYENDKVCYWKTNKFIPICNCSSIPDPPEPEIKPRTFSVTTNYDKVGVKIDNNTEIVNTNVGDFLRTIDSIATITAKATNHTFKGWYKYVNPNNTVLPPINEMLESAILYSNNITETINYDDLLDDYGVIFIAKWVNEETRNVFVFPAETNNPTAMADFSIDVTYANGETVTGKYFQIGSIKEGDSLIAVPKLNSEWLFDGWFKTYYDNNGNTPPQDPTIVNNAQLYSNNRVLSFTFDDLVSTDSNKRVTFIAKAHRGAATNDRTIYMSSINTRVIKKDGSNVTLGAFGITEDEPLIFTAESNSFVGWYRGQFTKTANINTPEDYIDRCQLVTTNKQISITYDDATFESNDSSVYYYIPLSN